METKIFNVEGMMCMHCKAHVESSLKALMGVKYAVANLEEKSVTVEFDPMIVSLNQLKEAVEQGGSYRLSI